MQLHFVRSISWSPTIALSWFWGLGFFYAIHVTLTNGWLGFLAFAVPNALGLGVFGWYLGSPRRDPSSLFSSVQGAYSFLFLFCQFLAVATTIFGFTYYGWIPLLGQSTPIWVLLLTLIACSTGHVMPLRRLKTLHSLFLVAGLSAAAVALVGLAATSGPTSIPLANFDGRFYGLAVPTLVGFLLGPWMDIQQWQRAVEIHRAGASVRLSYALGALLFFGLLTINAFLAAAAGSTGSIVSADGIPGAQSAVAMAIADRHPEGAAVAFVVWTAIAAVSTIDSFYSATRWMMTSLTTRSTSPLLAFVPAGLVSSPIWIVAGSLITAAVMIRLNLSLMYLMLPFATLLVGGAACLVCETLGTRRRYDPVLCFMIGLTASLLFLVGYVTPVPAFLAIAPIVGLLGALPMILEFFGWQTGLARPEVLAPTAAPTGGGRVVQGSADSTTSHGFDGQWFVMHLIPTYDDTNSVGNVYFANYIRWVGKARELFFNICMPDFDLKTTSFYVLTKSFNHDFRSEAAEFDAITVRIKIASHNRKFVTLAHEIHSELHGLLGRGEQSLMFVDTVHYRPLDIPRSIIEGFLPYWPSSSAHSPKLPQDPAPALPVGRT